jgi:hypothetical protein
MAGSRIPAVRSRGRAGESATRLVTVTSPLRPGRGRRYRAGEYSIITIPWRGEAAKTTTGWWWCRSHRRFCFAAGRARPVRCGRARWARFHRPPSIFLLLSGFGRSQNGPWIRTAIPMGRTDGTSRSMRGWGRGRTNLTGLHGDVPSILLMVNAPAPSPFTSSNLAEYKTGTCNGRHDAYCLYSSRRPRRWCGTGMVSRTRRRPELRPGVYWCLPGPVVRRDRSASDPRDGP